MRSFILFTFVLTGLISAAILAGCSDQDAFVYRSDSFRVSISERGQVIRMQDWTNGTDYVSRPAPLLQIRKQGEYSEPQRAVAIEGGIELTFPDGFIARVAIEEKDTHITFELADLTDADSVDLVLWGPFAASIDGSIGETCLLYTSPSPRD